jgi:hypothetical protein
MKVNGLDDQVQECTFPCERHVVVNLVVKGT